MKGIFHILLWLILVGLPTDGLVPLSNVNAEKVANEGPAILLAGDALTGLRRLAASPLAEAPSLSSLRAIWGSDPSQQTRALKGPSGVADDKEEAAPRAADTGEETVLLGAGAPALPPRTELRPLDVGVVGAGEAILHMLEHKKRGMPLSLALASAADAFRDVLVDSRLRGWFVPEGESAWHLIGLGSPNPTSSDGKSVVPRRTRASARGRPSIWWKLLPLLLLPVALLSFLATAALGIVSAFVLLLSLGVGLVLLMSIGVVLIIYLVVAGIVNLFSRLKYKTKSSWDAWQQSREEKKKAKLVLAAAEAEAEREQKRQTKIQNGNEQIYRTASNQQNHAK